MTASPSGPKSAALSGGVDAVDRALAILASFVPGREKQTLAQIAAATGLYKSTILRLARSLEHGGYLHRHPDGTFAPGPEPLRLAAIYKRGLRLEERVRPILRALVAQTGESASFFRREGDLRLCLYREETPRAIRDHIMEGDFLPLGVGAAGHVLAMADQAAWDGTPIVSTGERDAETAAIAAPVFDLQGRLSMVATALATPAFAVEEDEAVATRLLAACRLATQACGGVWPA